MGDPIDTTQQVALTQCTQTQPVVGVTWVSFVRDVRRDAGLCSTGSVAVAEPLN